MVNKKKIFFSKMHGLGNDFVIVDNINQNIEFTNNMIIKLSNRNTGIGFDQLLIVERPNNLNFDFNYRIFNSDGSEVYQCGNGARCFAYFVYLKRMTNKKKLFVTTYNNFMLMQFFNKNNIIVNMGKPTCYFKNFGILNTVQNYMYHVKMDKMIIKFGLVFVGNLHCIILVKDIKICLVKKIGQFLNNQKYLFPHGVNVNFIEIVSRKHVLLRVYERGVGETQACGSGACASVVFGIKMNFLCSTVIVTLYGGKLQIMWSGDNSFVYMNGSANHIYDGYIYIN